MEIANSRGQCAIEMVLVLIALTTVVLLTQQLAKQARGYFKPALLSKEVRR